MECNSHIRKFCRECPSCKKSIHYKTYKIFWNAKKFQKLCRSCSKTSKNNPLYGKHQSEEHRNKISISNKGKRHSEESKDKIRIAYINRIKSQGVIVSYNPFACQFIDQLNKQKGWNLQHALNGGEIELYGYFVDGYDKTKNIVFEYDEKRHEFGDKKIKDLKRIERLIEKINCRVVRYSEKFNVLYQSTPSYSEVL